MTKTTTRYGMFGVAAIVAILSISLVATNLTSEAAAGSQSANKVGSVTNLDTFTKTDVTDGFQGVPIASYDMKSSDDKEWLSTFITECKTIHQVKASGQDTRPNNKNKDFSTDTAGAGALIWWTISDANNNNHRLITPYGVISGSVWNGDTPHLDYTWQMCGEETTLDVNLNQLIIQCDPNDPKFQDDEGNPLCHEGQLVFKCSFEDALNSTDDEECWQSVALTQSNWGTHSAAQMILDVPHGVHWITIWGEGYVDPSDNVIPDTLTLVQFGKKILINQPVLIDNPTS